MQELKIEFGTRITEAFIDEYFPFVNESFSYKGQVIFDLTKSEWISTEGIALLYGWFYRMYKCNNKFLIRMPSTTTQKGYRLFEYLWSTWNICSFLDLDESGLNYKDIDRYFETTSGQSTLMTRFGLKRQARTGSLIQQGKFP